MAIKSNLSTLMGARRLSIADVHAKTGLSRKTISSLYNDVATRLDYETINKLCALLECNVGDILMVCSDSNKHNGTDMEASK